VEHEFRGQLGHPSSYAFVRFECAPADDLSFQVRASWPSTVSQGDRTHADLGIAEGVADILLEGLYQYSGCAIVLVDVRWDDVGSSVAAFMKATKSAMQQLVACRSEFVTADAAGGVRVFPLDGPSIGGVGVDIASEFASQIGN
jgi:hypothetical protein